MKLLIDENVRQEVKDFLCNSGFDAVIVPSGLKDSEVAEIAKREHRIIITHDIHFSHILNYPPEEFSGIIRLKIHPPTADDIIAALTQLFKTLSAEKIRKKLIILEKEGFRIR